MNYEDFFVIQLNYGNFPFPSFSFIIFNQDGKTNKTQRFVGFGVPG